MKHIFYNNNIPMVIVDKNFKGRYLKSPWTSGTLMTNPEWFHESKSIIEKAFADLYGAGNNTMLNIIQYNVFLTAEESKKGDILMQGPESKGRFYGIYAISDILINNHLYRAVPSLRFSCGPVKNKNSGNPLNLPNRGVYSVRFNEDGLRNNILNSLVANAKVLKSY